ncbi:MAG: VCBS repeat-containing protein [Candidatus Krumholzibacteriota bacterium]|nr:VCBS repeat-containing protein [Candidatus Krumholzibacteriota bacterium]
MRSLLFAAILLVLAPCAIAATIHVIEPDGGGDYPTIQAAVNAAQDGDVIELVDGVYTGPGNRAIVVDGLSVTIRARYGDPTACIIDCESLGRGFSFTNQGDDFAVLRGVTLRNGDADNGGGVYCGNYAKVVITQCIIEDCHASEDGGGIYMGGIVKVNNNIIQRNLAEEDGGGLCGSGSVESSFTNNLVLDNISYLGGAGVHFGPTAFFCTFAYNNYYDPPWPSNIGIQYTHVSHSIIINDFYLVSAGSINYTCCNYPDLPTGEGNFQANPAFTSGPLGNYYLQLGSACIDAGQSSANDFSFESANGTIHMNHMTTRATDAFDTGLADLGFHYRHYTPIYVPDDYPSIQAAIDSCVDGEAIIVRDGLYQENVSFLGKLLSLSSENGPETTIIDANSVLNGAVVTFDGHEGRGTLLAGLSLINGYAYNGGGIWCHESSPMILDNIIRDNTTETQGGGIGCYDGSRPLIQGNDIHHNETYYYGGGINIHDATPEIRDNTIHENSSQAGAGLAISDSYVPVIEDNGIYANDATYAGAVYCSNSIVTLARCTLAANSVANHTSGIYSRSGSEATLENCIIALGIGGDGAACYQGTIDLYCCDVFDNDGTGWTDCIAGQETGDHNLELDPQFCDPEALDFALQETSPCLPENHPEGGVCGIIGAYGIGCASASAFTNVTGPPLDETSAGWGAAWGDYDADGAQDLYLANYNVANRLFHNEGGGSFSDATADPLGDAGPARGAAWGDYDNDGRPDLYLANWYGTANHLFHNDGGGAFSDATSGPLGHAGYGTSVAWADYDNDGDLDLYLANQSQANKLFRNDGGGVFTDATSGPLGNSGSSQGVAWGDYDNDGDLDLYLTNDGQSNKLLRNDGGGTFADVTSAPLNDAGHGYGVAWGDYDNDGDLDLYLANWTEANKLFRNDGGVFTDATTAPLDDAGPGQGVAWGDYDNDGDLDLYLTQQGEANKLFRNEGGGTFFDATIGPLGDESSGRGVAWCDYDADGDLDLFIANSHQPPTLLRNNDESGNHWLHVTLVGTVSNASGIGARVLAQTGGTTQIREVEGGSGFCSQNSLPVEFGLGAAATVDVLIIRWPSGIEQVLTDVTADRMITVIESEDATEDIIGIYTTDDGYGFTTMEVAPYTPFTVYLMLLDASDMSGVMAWECSVDISSNIMILGWTPAGDGLFIGGIPGSVTVGLPVPLAWSDAIPLASMLAWVMDEEPARFYIGPHDPSSVDPPAPCWVAAADPMTMIPMAISSGSQFEPVFVVNQGSVGVDDPEPAARFALLQNHPNPFNPTTTIAYTLAAPSPARLSIYDLQGRLVRTLRDEALQPAGYHELVWNGRDDAGEAVPSGVYIYRLDTGSDQAAGRMVLLK